MRIGRAALFTAGAVLAAYAALRIINEVVTKNGGTELLPDPLAPLFAKLSKSAAK